MRYHELVECPLDVGGIEVKVRHTFLLESTHGLTSVRFGGRAPPLVVEVMNPSQAAELNGATPGLARLAQARAADGDPRCEQWARGGECEASRAFLQVMSMTRP